jgi:hypothetical protein
MIAAWVRRLRTGTAWALCEIAYWVSLGERAWAFGHGVGFINVVAPSAVLDVELLLSEEFQERSP